MYTLFSCSFGAFEAFLAIVTDYSLLGFLDYPTQSMYVNCLFSSSSWCFPLRWYAIKLVDPLMNYSSKV